MKQLNRTDFPGAAYPEKVIQFGEGNFLRAFVDWQIDILNEQTSLNAGITIIRPIDTDFPPSLSTQDGLYTTLIRGINEQGDAVRQPRLIRSVNQELNCFTQFDDVLASARNPDVRFIFSNTTEAGITYIEGEAMANAPAVTYPAKLTRLLVERFECFKGAADKGLVIIPCELIDYNGQKLKEYVLKYAVDWELSSEFVSWVEDHNTFCSTLVDRIVTGFPRTEHQDLQIEFDYEDQFVDTAEYFYLFVIQGPQWLAKELCLDQLPTDKQMNIRIVEDIKPYKERKVAILNGAHTAMVPVAFLAGIDTVGDAMDDAQMKAFVENTIAHEIVPTLDLPKDELDQFSKDVLDRFRNPYIKHMLISISLNSMTKYRTRILPQLLRFNELKGQLPQGLTFALAALIAFYQGKREAGTYELTDDEKWLDLFSRLWPDYEAQKVSLNELVATVLSDADHWEQDLTSVDGLADAVTSHLSNIVASGIRAAMPTV